MKILERDTGPATLEDALRVACRLEAIRKTVDDEHVEDAKRKEKNIRGVTRPSENGSKDQTEKKCLNLRRQ